MSTRDDRIRRVAERIAKSAAPYVGLSISEVSQIITECLKDEESEPGPSDLARDFAEWLWDDGYLNTPRNITTTEGQLAFRKNLARTLDRVVITPTLKAGRARLIKLLQEDSQ